MLENSLAQSPRIQRIESRKLANSGFQIARNLRGTLLVNAQNKVENCKRDNSVTGNSPLLFIGKAVCSFIYREHCQTQLQRYVNQQNLYQPGVDPTHTINKRTSNAGLIGLIVSLWQSQRFGVLRSILFLNNQHFRKIMWRSICFAFLFLAVCPVKLSEVHEVVVIGAGIAGLQASKKLSQYGVQHLIIESRNRVGGRIHTGSIEGIEVDLGAQYIHAKSNNAMHIITDDMEWEAHSTDEDEHFYYQDHGEIDSQVEDLAGQIHDKLLEKTIHAAYTSIHDLSAEEAGKTYFEQVVSKHKPIVRDMVSWHSYSAANNEGAEYKDMSGRELDDDDTLEYRPKGGYSALIKAMLEKSKGKLHLGERVVKIDYTGKYVQITTDKRRAYYAKRVISSLPLGVLKANIVKFVPPLSDKYSKLIEKIGIGNLNKLYVSFTQRFWGNYGGWINFVTKDTENNKYPVAVVNSAEDKNILCFFLAGKGSNEVHKMSPEEIKEDITQEMKKFFHHHEIKVRDIMLSRWDSDQNSLGSYSFYKVGTTKNDITELRHPIAGRIWFVGEHTHPLMSSMTQGAYQTGLWAAEEAMESLGYNLNKPLQRQHEDEDSDQQDSESEEEQ